MLSACRHSTDDSLRLLLIEVTPSNCIATAPIPLKRIAAMLLKIFLVATHHACSFCVALFFVLSFKTVRGTYGSARSERHQPNLTTRSLLQAEDAALFRQG